MSRASWRASLGVAAAILLHGCAAGAYFDAAVDVQSSNPHAALEYVAQCLEVDPGYTAAHDLLTEEILRNIALEHEAKVASLTAAGSYEEAIADCDRVVASAHLARSLPGSSYQIFHEEHRSHYAGEAAQKFYDIGQDYESQRDPKEAAKAYRRALGFRTNFEDARARYQACVAAARVRIAVTCADPGRVRRAADSIVRRLGPATRERGLEFLEFVSSPEQADAVCEISVFSTFHDTGWQGSNDQAQREVQETDPNTGQKVKVIKRAQWTIYERTTSIDLTATFSVRATRGQTPEPAGQESTSARDQGRYATWSGDRGTVPAWVLNLPSTPVNLKDEQVLASESADAVIDRLAHQLFLAFK
jgi:hypothetical protein